MPWAVENSDFGLANLITYKSLQLQKALNRTVTVTGGNGYPCGMKFFKFARTSDFLGGVYLEDLAGE